MNSFWDKLKKPIMALAPLANVTDASMRRLISKYGKPSVCFTEFVSADGLFSGDERARSILMRDLLFTESERPIVAQFFTSAPEKMEEAARLAHELSFDGVDINMGCPDKSVEKQGAGAALIKNPECAVELIRSAKKGAQGLPISIKTRIGYSKNELSSWLPVLLQEKPQAITLHLRTRKEMSNVPAHWELVKDVLELRNKISPETLILGNGDVISIEDGKKKVEESGVDGVMIGRGIFGNPFLFNPNKDIADLSLKERLAIMIEHTKLFEELLGDVKNFAIMKKHFKAYASDFDGVKELRIALMDTANREEVEDVVRDFLN